MALPETSLGYVLTADDSNSTPAGNWEIVDVTPPGSEVDDIDTSHQGTTTVRTHKAAPLKENDELVLECHEDPTNYPVVGAANEEWGLTCPDASVQTFDGYVKAHKAASHTLANKTMMTITIKVAGPVVIT